MNILHTIYTLFHNFFKYKIVLYITPATMWSSLMFICLLVYLQEESLELIEYKKDVRVNQVRVQLISF